VLQANNDYTKDDAADDDGAIRFARCETPKEKESFKTKYDGIIPNSCLGRDFNE
jgi:hypothetical protein